MPFTPFHMGPAIVIKAGLQRYFSLVVFGLSQILMDLHPLYVMIKGSGHVHGFTHTYLGATIVAVLSVVVGKFLGEKILKTSNNFFGSNLKTEIAWSVIWISSFIGTYSHVFLDSIMHGDVQPFYPWSLVNNMWHIISVESLHVVCIVSVIVGGGFYFLINFFSSNKLL